LQRSEIEAFLEGKPLHAVLDVKSMVLDQIRQMPQEELDALFWDKLPELSLSRVEEYLFMNRD